MSSASDVGVLQKTTRLEKGKLQNVEEKVQMIWIEIGRGTPERNGAVSSAATSHMVGDRCRIFQAIFSLNVAQLLNTTSLFLPSSGWAKMNAVVGPEIQFSLHNLLSFT